MEGQGGDKGIGSLSRIQPRNGTYHFLVFPRCQHFVELYHLATKEDDTSLAEQSGVQLNILILGRHKQWIFENYSLILRLFLCLWVEVEAPFQVPTA